MLADYLKLLGMRATDPVTGMAGVITSVCFDLNGCVQGALMPPANKDGGLSQSMWIDVQRLNITGDTPVCAVSDFRHQTGCVQKPSK